VWRIDIGGSGAFNKFDKNYVMNGKIMEFRKAQVLEIINDKEINILT